MDILNGMGIKGDLLGGWSYDIDGDWYSWDGGMGIVWG